MADLWDPLDAVKDHSPDLLVISRKREMQNILKSYVGFYDPFSELIQNAMDAVDARERECKEPGYRKKLFIDIDLSENSVSVTDNGVGFPPDKFKMFLCPNISFKDGLTYRGKKGVGATYLAYAFNHLTLGTKSPGYQMIAELKNGRCWLDDTRGNVPRPKVTDAEEAADDFDSIDRGSTFTLHFGGENTRPKDLRWVGATTADQWKTILLLKTPLGAIDFRAKDSKPIQFDLTVTDHEGRVTSLEDQDATYVYPHCVISGSASLDEILSEQSRRMSRNLDPAKLPERYKQLNGVYKIWNTEDLLNLLAKSEDTPRRLVQEYGMEAYGYFCYSVRVWDHFNDVKAQLRKGNRILRGGLQLATDHMPQGDLIVIPLTNNIGYQNQAHVIVHFQNADPDLGRKGFQPELRDAAEVISVWMVGNLKRWRHLLKKDSGAAPSIIDEGELDGWIQQQRSHEQAKPLRITNPNFFIPINEVSITSEPMSEQDVIALFNQLVAGGVVRGIKLMATSSHMQYDGIYRYYVKPPTENHVFDKARNPLGVPEIHTDSEYTSKHSCPN